MTVAYRIEKGTILLLAHFSHFWLDPKWIPIRTTITHWQHIVGSTDQADIDIQSDQTTVSSSLRAQAEQFTLPDCFEKVGAGRKNIRCNVCFGQMNVVSIFVHNGKHHIPVICSEKGDQNRKATIEKHLQSQCHKSAVLYQKLASLRSDQLQAFH